MPACPPLYVSPSPAPPARFGLIDSALPLDVTNDHVRCGVQWEPLRCDPALPYPAPCPPGNPDPQGPTKPEMRGVPIVEADSITVFSSYACALPSMGDPAIRARLAAELQRGEGRALEAAFWAGTVGGTPLAQGLGNAALSPDAVIIGAGACVAPDAGIGALEDFLGDCYGGEGFIHMPRGLVAGTGGSGYFVREGPKLRSLVGTTIVAGGGYPGTGPDGAAPTDGCAWAFATGTVYLWRGPIEYTAGDPAQYANLANNDAVLVAERTYVVTFDCCLAAVQLKMSCCC